MICVVLIPVIGGVESMAGYRYFLKLSVGKVWNLQ